MPGSIFETRFCRFERPSGWLRLPGVGVLENRSTGARSSAVVMENWLAEPQTAAAFAEKQRAAILSERAGVLVLEEKPVAQGPLAGAHWQAFRLPMPGGGGVRQEQVIAVEGPLAACLTVTGLETERDTWKRSLEPVRASFDVPGRDKLRRIARAPLLAPPAGPVSGSMRPVPSLQIALPVRDGWRFDEADAALRSPEGAEITVFRSGLKAFSPEELFAEAVSRAVREPTITPLAWDTGRTAQGRTAWVLESTTGVTSSWVKKEPRTVRDIFVKDDAALAFRFSAAKADARAHEVLAEVIGGYALLPPAERKLETAIAWMPLSLSGAWQQSGPGIFVRATRPSVLFSAQVQPPSPSAKKLSELAAASLRSAGDIREILREGKREERRDGATIHCYALDFAAASGADTWVRAAWFEARNTLCSLMIRGETPEVNDLFTQCLAAVRPELVPPDEKERTAS